MKLLDLNTHSWIEANPLEKLQQLVEFIQQGDYDVITLQEVNQLMTEETWQPDEWFCPVAEQRAIKQDNFAKVLVERLREYGVNYYWSWADAHIGYDKYDEGVAILSKEPLEASAHWVSLTQDRSDYHTRVVLVAKTSIEERSVQIASGHFSWWDNGSPEAFTYEWQQTQQLLQEESLPIILMGDFNNPADKRNEGYDLMMTSGLDLQDAFTVAEMREGEHTVAHAIDGWSGNSELLRIDLALFSSAFQVEKYRVVLDGNNGPQVSDHFGIEVVAMWETA